MRLPGLVVRVHVSSLRPITLRCDVSLRSTAVVHQRSRCETCALATGVRDSVHNTVKNQFQIIPMRIPTSQKGVKFISKVYSHRILIPVSQSELAKDLGLTRQTIASIESGKKQPSLLTAFRIAEYLRVKIEDLFTFKP